MSTLVLPIRFIEIEEEEMMYLEGGWSVKTLSTSLTNLYNKYSFAGDALKVHGYTLGVIASMGKGAIAYSRAKIASVLGSIAAANWVIGVVIGVTAAASIYAMGSKVRFA